VLVWLASALLSNMGSFAAPLVPRHHPASPHAGAGWNVLPKQAVALTASGAVLGPMLDGLHSKAGVLQYAQPIHIPLVPGVELETCW
jgi:hypothetical protein